MWQWINQGNIRIRPWSEKLQHRERWEWGVGRWVGGRHFTPDLSYAHPSKSKGSFPSLTSADILCVKYRAEKTRNKDIRKLPKMDCCNEWEKGCWNLCMPHLEHTPLYVLCVWHVLFKLPKDQTCFFLFLEKNDQDIWPFVEVQQCDSFCFHHCPFPQSPPSSQE